MPWGPIGNRRSASSVNCVKYATENNNVSNWGLHRQYVSGRHHQYNLTMINHCIWNLRVLNIPGNLSIQDNTIEDISISCVLEIY